MKKLITKQQFTEDYKLFTKEMREISRVPVLTTRAIKELKRFSDKIRDYLEDNIPLHPETEIWDIHHTTSFGGFMYRIRNTIIFELPGIGYGSNEEPPKIKHIAMLDKKKIMGHRNIGKRTIKKMEELLEMANLEWESK